MKESIRKEILSVLKDTLKAVKGNDLVKLRTLSKDVIHNASIYQDNYNISAAILIYSLFKILGNDIYKKNEDWDQFYDDLLGCLKESINSLEKGNVEKFKLDLNNIFKLILDLEKNAGMFVRQVIEATRVKKASNLYEYGISVGRVAELLGISEWELMGYIGSTKINEMPLSRTKSIVERLAYTKKIFNLR